MFQNKLKYHLYLNDNFRLRQWRKSHQVHTCNTRSIEEVESCLPNQNLLILPLRIFST